MKLKIEQLSRNLKRVHKLMLENERIATEGRLNRPIAPLEFFNLLTQDPSFQWMKPISALIAEIDEFVDESVKEGKPITEHDLNQIRERVEFTLLDAGSSISERYLQYLSQDTDLVIAHADLRADLGPAKKKSIQ